MKNKIFMIIGIVGISLMLVGIGINVFVVKSAKQNNNSEKNEKNEKKEEKMNSGYPDSKYFITNEDGSLVNTSDKMKVEHTNGDFTINNMAIAFNEENEYLANYSYEIKNNGIENYSSVDISIVFIFADGSKRNCSSSKIENLFAGQSIKVDRKDYISIVGAVDYEFVINK